MSIFKNYTGNAMLNNALMTIEALGKLKSVDQITPNFLLDLYASQDLKEINKRLKSYTMLFSLNNPLVTPTKKQDNMGEKTYHRLLTSIMNNYENEGSKLCELSGLRFEKTFEAFYMDEIELQKKAVKLKKLDTKEEKKLISNLENTDFSLNRCWFPLIGGLGSDAQALPQAKFTIQIHPICIVIMQFLPLSSLLYKGGILLIDSSNFEFSRIFIDNNVKELQKRIELTKSTDSVENVKDFSKGSYLLKALEILENKELEEEYSDLNLWSFTNSGTGASCEIDRVPNVLMQKLIQLKRKSTIRKELIGILNRTESSFTFLSSLEGNIEWWLLYPNVFGSGKKAVPYDGVSVAFLEAYFKVIGSEQKIEYAKYLAYLIHKYKSKSFEKYLSKTDAWSEKEYRTDLYVVFAEATKNGEWDLARHLEILDNKEQVPVKNNYYNIHKITHYYYQKKVFNQQLPKLKSESTNVSVVCNWFISLIQSDEKGDKIIKDLVNTQNYSTVGYTDLLIRMADDIDLSNILYALYDENLRISKFGLNELLHLFFLQITGQKLETKKLEMPTDYYLDLPTKEWLVQIQVFSEDYQFYYFDKYENKTTGNKPLAKFKNQIMSIPDNNAPFLRWFEEASENTNQFLKGEKSKMADKWSDSLLYNGQGDFAPTFAKFILKFFLLKQYHKISFTISNNVIS